MATGDTYQLNCECATLGRSWTWIWQYQQVSGTNDASTLEELAIAFNLGIAPTFLDILSQNADWLYTTAFNINKNAEIPGGAALISTGGTVAGDAMPDNMAAKVGWKTTAPNSKHNGSTSWSGISVNDQDNGSLSAALITRIALLQVELKKNITGIGGGSAQYQPIILSRWLDGLKRTPPVPFAIISSSISTRMGNMRRRMIKTRRHPG